MNKEDDDEGGFFGMFGEEEEEEEERQEQSFPSKPQVLPPLKDPTCPLVDPKNARILVRYVSNEKEEFLPATVFGFDGQTYTIKWVPSGVLQYRVDPQSIDWKGYDISEVEEIKPVPVVSLEDELWLAARRGDLPAVKRFIYDLKVDKNDPGKDQSRTPLYHAVFCGHRHVVEFLLSLGCRDEDGTAIITANEEIRLLLLSGERARRRSSAGSQQQQGKRKSSLLLGLAGVVDPMPTTAEEAAARRKSSVTHERKPSTPALPPLSPETDQPQEVVVPIPVVLSPAEERKNARKSKRVSVTFEDQQQQTGKSPELKEIVEEPTATLSKSTTVKRPSKNPFVRLVGMVWIAVSRTKKRPL